MLLDLLVLLDCGSSLLVDVENGRIVFVKVGHRRDRESKIR